MICVLYLAYSFAVICDCIYASLPIDVDLLFFYYSAAAHVLSFLSSVFLLSSSYSTNPSFLLQSFLSFCKSNDLLLHLTSSPSVYQDLLQLPGM